MADIYIGDRKVNELYVGTQRVYAVDNNVSFGCDGYIHIGSHDYPYKKLGNRKWCLLNLYENILTNRNVYKDVSTPMDASKYGLLYLGTSEFSTEGQLQLASILPSGWRVATEADWRDLTSNGSDWNNGKNFDLVGKLNIVPTGVYREDGGDVSYFSSGTNFYVSNSRQIFFGYGNYFFSYGTIGNNYFMPIRVCADA